MKPYQYDPIRTDRNEIRLIRLWPGPASSSEIKIEIYRVSQDQKPAYEALSYVWGSPERTDVAVVVERILATGPQSKTTLPITHNLAVALRYLKHPTRKRTLWIDAICINQEDVPERNEQVEGMGNIYRNAEQVVVWLGPGSENSNLAFETLQRIADSIVYDLDRHLISCKSGSWAWQVESEAGGIDSIANSWVAILDILRREWFTRLWVFQEIVLAKRATVRVGNVSLPWQDFRAVLNWMKIKCVFTDSQHLGVMTRLVFDDSSIFHFLEASLRPEFQFGLSHLTRMTKNLKCSDPRDRIFATQGLLGDGTKLIKPDYAEGVENIYTAATIAYIKKYSDIEYLHLCGECSTKSTSTLILPSWVLDFSSQKLALSELCFQWSAGESKSFCAISEDDNTLEVQGLRIATISEISTSLVTSVHTIAEIIQICEEWRSMISEAYPMKDEEVLSEDFWATLMCGEILERMPSGYGSYTSAKEFQEIFQRHGCGKNASRLARMIREAMRGRAFFLADTHLFGACPESSRPGDMVVLLLGNRTLLVIREVGTKTNIFQVVGQCYMPNFANAEAILGQLPTTWKSKIIVKNIRYITLYEDGTRTTRQDPRAFALPSDWRARYGPFDRPPHHEPDEEDDMTMVWYENVVTREWTYFDPRMEPDFLRARGVNVETFVLV